MWPQQLAQRKDRVKEIGLLHMHQDCAAQDPIEPPSKGHADLRQCAAGKSSFEFGVVHDRQGCQGLGWLDAVGVVAGGQQLTQIASRAGAYVKDTRTTRESGAEPGDRAGDGLIPRGDFASSCGVELGGGGVHEWHANPRAMEDRRGGGCRPGLPAQAWSHPFAADASRADV